jgi:hypothetical protein
LVIFTQAIPSGGRVAGLVQGDVAKSKVDHSYP